jgi:LysM repeat protein
MNVTLKMSRAENIAKYGEAPVSLDIEEYLCGVVPAEIYESAAMDALRAQAVAARTYAVKRALAGAVMGDTSSGQLFRSSLLQPCPRSRQAVSETKGQVLYHGGKLIDCFYSASNNGLTKRSGDVWRTHYPYYVNKEDAWDIAANREKPAKAGHGVGLSQVGAMWAGKNGVSYPAILAFYYEGTALVSNYGQGDVLLPEEENPLTLHVRIMTRNDSYAYGRKIVPRGIMVHSTAAPGVMAAAWFDRWNRSYKAGETARQVSVHAFVDNMEVWQYLPWDQRAWHAAGAANDTHIAFELCEPSGHTYASGGQMVGYDAARHEPYFRAMWQNAVALCVRLCRQFNLSTQNIIGHFEGFKMGIANNHADPGHWFPRHGESMDTFRAAVGTALAGFQPQPDPMYARYVVKAGDTLWAVARDRLGSGTRYREIAALNNLRSDLIRVGQTLLLPE